MKNITKAINYDMMIKNTGKSMTNYIRVLLLYIAN